MGLQLRGADHCDGERVRMSGFNREELSRCSKAELLDYIEQQYDQLSRFETRFRGESVQT